MTLNDITAKEFQQMYMGLPSSIKHEDCERLIADYLSIVGGGRMNAQIDRRNEELKVRMRIVCLNVIMAYISGGMIQEASSMMGELGYKCEPDEIRRKAMGILANDRYRLARIEKAHTEEKHEPLNEEYFCRERVALMKYMGMYIDMSLVTAMEYAYMVKAMTDEAEQMEKELSKVKSNRNV